MPTDEQALLAAIWADPHDDLPRLVYADWLEETGVRLNRARAELIRVQCALERADDADERRVLREREDRLVKSNRQALTKGASGTVRRAEFSRGFPYPWAGWSSHWKTLEPQRLSEAPLWRLEIWPPKAGFAGLFQRPEAMRLGQLVIQSSAQKWIDQIASCMHLRNLARLELDGAPGGGDDQMLLALAGSPHLVSLSHLAWTAMSLTEAGVQAFCRSPPARRLRGLEFHNVGLTDRLLSVLSESPLRDGLRELSIREAAMGDAVVQYVTNKGWKLHRLEIVRSNLSDAGLERLAAWPGLADLEHLDLGYNSFGPAGGRALAASPYLKCSPHCSIRMPPEATGQEWADLLGPLGDNTTLVCLGTG